MTSIVSSEYRRLLTFKNADVLQLSKLTNKEPIFDRDSEKRRLIEHLEDMGLPNDFELDMEDSDSEPDDDEPNEWDTWQQRLVRMHPRLGQIDDIFFLKMFFIIRYYKGKCADCFDLSIRFENKQGNDIGTVIEKNFYPWTKSSKIPTYVLRDITAYIRRLRTPTWRPLKLSLIEAQNQCYACSPEEERVIPREELAKIKRAGLRCMDNEKLTVQIRFIQEDEAPVTANEPELTAAEEELVITNTWVLTGINNVFQDKLNHPERYKTYLFLDVQLRDDFEVESSSDTS